MCVSADSLELQTKATVMDRGLEQSGKHIDSHRSLQPTNTVLISGNKICIKKNKHQIIRPLIQVYPGVW